MAFQFIHAADLHIDSPCRGLDRYEGAPVEEIRGATRRSLENLVITGIEQSVDFVLLAGDIFDDDWKDFHTGLFFCEQMSQLRRHEIPVFIVHGNHDSTGGMTKRLPLPDNVITFSSRTAETYQLEDIQVAIHGRSFPERHVQEDFVPDYPEPVPDFFNIGMLHTSLDGREGHADYAPTTFKNLQNKGYDYWALGHVHKREVVNEYPRIVFPGNLQGRRAGEPGSKGFDLVTVTDEGEVHSEHVSADVVRWHQINLECAGINSLEALKYKAVNALSQAMGFDSERLHAVRVTLTGQSPLDAEEAKTPGCLAATVRASALELDDAHLWIEKVRNQLHPTIDRPREAERDDAIGELIRLTNRISSDPDSLRQFIQTQLDPALRVLPTELQNLEQLLEGEKLDQIMLDAESTIYATLTAIGGDA